MAELVVGEAAEAEYAAAADWYAKRSLAAADRDIAWLKTRGKVYQLVDAA